MKEYVKEAIEMAGEYSKKADEALSRLRWGWIVKVLVVIVWYILTGSIATMLISVVLSPLLLIDSSQQLYYGVQRPLRFLVCGCVRLPLFVVPLFFYFRWKRKQGNVNPQE